MGILRNSEEVLRIHRNSYETCFSRLSEWRPKYVLFGPGPAGTQKAGPFGSGRKGSGPLGPAQRAGLTDAVAMTMEAKP